MNIPSNWTGKIWTITKQQYSLTLFWHHCSSAPCMSLIISVTQLWGVTRYLSHKYLDRDDLVLSWKYRDGKYWITCVEYRENMDCRIKTWKYVQTYNHHLLTSYLGQNTWDHRRLQKDTYHNYMKKFWNQELRHDISQHRYSDVIWDITHLISPVNPKLAHQFEG